MQCCLLFPQTHSERAPEDEWLDILPHPVFSPDGDSFMLLAGIQETNTEHFTHIKHVTITQQRISVISHGRYEVSCDALLPSHPSVDFLISFKCNTKTNSFFLFLFTFMISRCFLFLHFCRSSFSRRRRRQNYCCELFIDGFSFHLLSNKIYVSKMNLCEKYLAQKKYQHCMNIRAE